MKNSEPYWIVKTHFLKNDEYICSVCKTKYDRAYKICPCCGTVIKKRRKNDDWITEAAFFDLIDD